MIIVGAPVSRDISIKRCQVTRPYINNVAPTLIVVNIVIHCYLLKNIGKDLDRLALGKTNLGKLDNTDHFLFHVCNNGLVSTPELRTQETLSYFLSLYFQCSKSLNPQVPYDTKGVRPSSSLS